MLERPRASGLLRATEDDYVHPLYRGASLTLACACLLLGYVWFYVAWTTSLQYRLAPRPVDIGAPAVLLLAASLALIVARASVAAGNALLVGGAILAQYLWPDPMRFLLAPTIVCLAGLILSREAALVAALAQSLLPGLPTGSLLAIWLGAAGFWVATHWISAALGQVSERHDSARRLEQEVLTRREELRRLNDSLRNAYALLERTNHELAEARDEAEQAQRLKSQFAATISHELRTPLNLILGFTQVMYKTPEAYEGAVFTPDLMGDLREVYKATAHLLDLIDDVLDLSRVSQVRLALMPEETDFAALIEDAISTVAGLFRSGRVSLHAEVPTGLPRCTVDLTRIRQVLINLLTNAARFTDCGEVRVSACHDAARDEVVTCISDTGQGIAPEDQEHLFDAFYQATDPLRRQQGGSGLGLAICKTFVQMHGGRIWVRSQPGVGSQFSFALPVRARLGSRADPDWRFPAAADPFDESVVTIDAEGATAKMLGRVLQGLRVHNCATPEEAPAGVAQWHPRAVIAFDRDRDGRRHHGLENVLQRPGLPVISCSLRQGARGLDRRQVRAVLRKPVDMPRLLQAVEAIGRVERLLLVDDDEAMTRLLQRGFGAAHPAMSIAAVHDGRQALEWMRRNRPDAAIVDLAMPEMDGSQLLEAMAACRLGDVPVVVLTGVDDPSADPLAVGEMVISWAVGISGVEAAAYLEAVAAVARPRYAAGPAARGALS